MAVTIKGFASDWSVPEPAQTVLNTLYDKVDPQGRQPVRKGELVLNVKDFGAVGDGVTDDNTAIRNAVAAASGKTLYFPPGTYYYKATGHLAVYARTTLKGDPGKSIIKWDATTPTNHYNLLVNEGDNVRVEGLTVERVANFPGIVMATKNFSGLTVVDCVFNGNRDLYSQYLHWMQINTNAGTLSNVTFLRNTVTKMNFGIYQNNTSVAIVRDVVISHCNFTANYATDLEFNSPVTDTFDVVVSENHFSDNRSATASGGFAVGLAHVTRCLIKGNTFDGYYNEAVHIEDWSTRVSIEGNLFTRCGTGLAGHLRITSGSDNITVTGNDFDAAANALVNDWHIIHCTGGPSGTTTVGGRVSEHPERIIISGNNIHAGKMNAIYMSFGKNSVIADNVIMGSGAVSGLVYDEVNTGYAIELHGGTDLKVSGNTIRGFQSMMRRAPTGTSTGGEGLTISHNTVSSCKYGISVLNNGAAVITGNMLRNVIHPMVAGQGKGTSKPVVITGNHADACKYPLEIGGKLVVVATAAAADGATTLAVEPLGMSIGAVHVITFPSGAVFTPGTNGASSGATSITGTLVGSVAAGDAGTINNMWHSWSGGTNRSVITGNADSVAGLYGQDVRSSPDGKRWRVVVGNDGVVTATAI